MARVVVVDYDARWPEIFEAVRSQIWPAVCDVATTIEHVGSTAVPGLAAKPIVDVSVVVPTGREVPIGIERLARIGYAHQGNLGIDGREAFASPPGLPRHNLYLCPGDSPALRNHLAVRDYLRAHPGAADAYGALKKRLATRFADDIGGYVDGKTDMLLGFLRSAGLDPAELETIERANRRR